MSVFNAYMALSGAIDADVTRDERLSRRTTYRIGGPAALVVRCNDHRSLVRTIDVLAHEQVKWVVMGKGSNVLVSDDGYDGCVILLGRDFSRVSFSSEEEGVVTVGAGGAGQAGRRLNVARPCRPRVLRRDTGHGGRRHRHGRRHAQRLDRPARP